MSNVILRSLSLFFLIFMLGACAKEVRQPRSPEEQLLRRVKAYWDLRVKGAPVAERIQFERCGLDPKCREALLSGGSKNSVTYYSYEILGVRFPDEKTALVKIRVRYKIPPILGKSFERVGTFEDKWVLIDGRWYHVIKGFATEW